jgi:hypothetical protein
LRIVPLYFTVQKKLNQQLQNMRKLMIIGMLCVETILTKAQIQRAPSLNNSTLQNTNTSPWPSSGNIGIGTVTPLHPLDVATFSADDGVNITQLQSGSGASALHLTNATSGGRHWALFSTGVGSIQGPGNFSIYEYTSGIDRFFINGNNGNVGINNNLPATRLDIAGGTQDGIRFSASTYATTALEIVASNTPTYSRFKTFATGQTYIGLFNSPAFDANASMLTIGQPLAANKAFNIVNNINASSPIDLFSVYGDGKTQIGTGSFLTSNKLLLAVDGDARFAFYGTGNAVGNGMEILGNNQVPYRRGMSVDNDNVSGAFNFYINSNQTAATFNFINGQFNTNLMTLQANGKTDITSSVTNPFRVWDGSAGAYSYMFNQSGGNVGMWTLNVLYSYGIGIDNTAVGHIWGDLNQSYKIVNFKQDASLKPQVWIGNNPIGVHSDFSFAVEGKIVAQSLYITAATSANWADYVFADNYKLPNLYDIESYYKTNKHLPEMPSAKEVEEKGINVGEMNTLLLKKVEELTMLMVKQQKEIDELKKKNE